MKELCSINGKVFYVQTSIENEIFTITVTDLINLWKEVCSKTSLLNKFKRLNPLVSSNDESIILDRILSMISEGVLDEKDDLINLNLAKKLGPVTMKMYFTLQKCPSDDFHSNVTLPMVVVVNELMEMQKKLCSLLKDKDLELREYKFEGGDISRDNVKTGEFDVEIFQNDFIQKFKDKSITSKLNMDQNTSQIYEEACRKIRINQLSKIKQEPPFAAPKIENITVKDEKKNILLQPEDYSIQRFKKQKKAKLFL